MNMQKLMQEATRMQREITKKQEEINSMKFEGVSGHVKVVLSGKKEVVSISFDKNLLKDVDDLEALEDMVKIAFNDAIALIDKEVESKLGVYAKGLNGLM